MSFTILIIVITAVISIPAFKNRELFEKLQFNPYVILKKGQWYRFITHGFVHADWEHLIFNMLSFYFFGDNVELMLGNKLYFLLFYLAALIFASSITFFKHKDNPYYNSIGASGAVSAIIFGSILFDPSSSIIIMPIPIPIPALLYGVLFILYSTYKGKRASDNINHDAHLMGAIFGFIVPIIINPGWFGQFIENLPFK